MFALRRREEFQFSGPERMPKINDVDQVLIGAVRKCPLNYGCR